MAETPKFTDVYDQPAPVGTVVKVYNPRGDVVSDYGVTTPGGYGFRRIYGEDATAVPPIPGMLNGELAEFRVSGALATATPLLYWQNNRGQYPVDLNAGTVNGQLISLSTGWMRTSKACPSP